MTHHISSQHTATHCNIPQYTATHCNTLLHAAMTATHCKTLHHTAAHCNTLQHTASHYITLQHTATHRNPLQRTATHCNALQQNITDCNSFAPVSGSFYVCCLCMLSWSDGTYLFCPIIMMIALVAVHISLVLLMQIDWCCCYYSNWSPKLAYSAAIRIVSMNVDHSLKMLQMEAYFRFRWVLLSLFGLDRTYLNPK